MSSTAAPYGLRPVNLIGGQPYAGSTRSLLIDPAGYGTNIFNGSVVYINSSGYINIVTATGADATTNAWPAGSSGMTGAVGVFVGCSYTNSMGQTVFGQYYPANALNGVAYVVDDPDAVFMAQLDGSGAQTVLGSNTYFAAAQSTSTGSTTTGNSTSALTASTVTTTAPFRIVGFANNINSAVGDAYTDVLVKFNIGWHSYTTAVGL